MFLLVVLIFFAFLPGLWSILHVAGPRKRMPPGPWGLPVVGNLLMLGDLPHCTLQKLSAKYGSIMYIRLGLVPAIVVSSPESAELFLKIHDLAFASRPNSQASEYLSYGRKNLIFAPYGSYWRQIRKLCTLELLSSSKVELFRPIRRQEVLHFVELLKAAAESQSEIDVTSVIGSLIEDMTYRLVFGFKDDRFNLKSSIGEGVMLNGAFNVADFIPFLGALDPQGLHVRMRKVSKTIDEFLEKIINEHNVDANRLHGRHRDFIDVILSMIDSNNTQEHLGRDNIKAIILDMLAAGMDTTATVIEWTVAELLKHPRVMKLLQEELRNKVGLDRMAEESDLARLDYLKIVVKESMRLHPVAPLLIRESIRDIQVSEYFIPERSRILVNTWAIGRDPNFWSSNAEEFYPERFRDASGEVPRRDFKFLPFGAGRRNCPGQQLGSTVVELIVAQLVHCFNLELPGGMSPSDLDMREKFGLTLPRANHLVAVPTFRLSM